MASYDINKICKLYYDNSIFKINTKNLFTFSSGIQFPIYIDNRMWFSFPDSLSIVLDKIILFIKQNYSNATTICAVPNAGIPFGVLIAYKLNLKFIYLRKEKKQYGILDKIFEGFINKSEKILLFEDTITTGKSALNSKIILEKYGYNVIGICSLYTHNIWKNNNAKKINIKSLVTLDDLLLYCKNNKIMTEEEEMTVLQYRNKYGK